MGGTILAGRINSSLTVVGRSIRLKNYRERTTRYALWARYTVVRNTFGAIYTLYAIYFASEMQYKIANAVPTFTICHFQFAIQ